MSSNLIIGTKLFRSEINKKNRSKAAEKVQRLTESINIVSTGTIYDLVGVGFYAELEMGSTVTD